jgi:hypothetical protein
VSIASIVDRFLAPTDADDAIYLRNHIHEGSTRPFENAAPPASKAADAEQPRSLEGSFSKPQGPVPREVRLSAAKFFGRFRSL